MRRRLRDEDGSTLIELLIATAITVVIMGVIAASLILGLKSNKQVSDDLLDSHDAQLVSVYLPSDLLSAQPGKTTIDRNAGTGCAGSPSEPWNVVRLTWAEPTATGEDWYRVAYRVVKNGDDWRLARFSCMATSEASLGSAPAATRLLVRNLKPVVTSADLPTTIEDGERLKIRLTDASGYSFTIAGSRRMLSDPGAPVAPRPRVVEVSGSEMFDDDTNGYVDRVTMQFSGPLPAPCRNDGYFSLETPPSGATIDEVDFGPTGSSLLTIDLVEGSGPADTSFGEFHVQFTPATGCDALAYDGPPVADRAAPVAVVFAAGPTGTTNPDVGRAEPGDTFVIQFSEPIVGVPTSGTLLLTGAAPSTIEMPGLTRGRIGSGLATYFSPVPNRDAEFPITTAADTTGTTFTVTLGACLAGPQNACELVTQSLLDGVMTFLPATTLKDSSGNVAVEKAVQPVPTGPFKAF